MNKIIELYAKLQNQKMDIDIKRMELEDEERDFTEEYRTLGVKSRVLEDVMDDVYKIIDAELNAMYEEYKKDEQI